MVLSTPSLLQDILPQFWNACTEIALAPVRNPQMMWIVLPLAVALLLMEFYFGRYRREELGWNTAVGNSLVLIFVSLDLFRQLYSGAFTEGMVAARLMEAPGSTLIAAAVGIGGMTILVLDFFHAWPKSVAFTVSSTLPINFLAYLAIVIVYTGMDVRVMTVIAALFLFVLLRLLFGLVHLLEPEYVAHYEGNILYKVLHLLVKSEERMHKAYQQKKKSEKPIIPALAVTKEIKKQRVFSRGSARAVRELLPRSWRGSTRDRPRRGSSRKKR